MKINGFTKTVALWATALCLSGLHQCPALGNEPGGAGGRLDRIKRLAGKGKTRQALAGLARLLEALPADERMICWKSDPPKGFGFLHDAWRVGDRLVFTNRRGNILLQLDIKTGKGLSPLIQAAFGSVQLHRVWPTDDGRRLLLLSSQGVRLVDAQTGRTLKSVAGAFDPRIGPVPCKDGFLAVPGAGGGVLARLNWSGKRLWKCTLPEMAEHAAVFGAILVVESRQQTAAIDMNTGRRLWTGGAGYSRGAALGDDATYVIEAGLTLAPDRTTVEIVRRDARCGKEEWKYVHPGFIGHKPVVRKAGDRVFVLFSSGRLVCLDGRSGKVRWSRRLSAPTPDHGGGILRRTFMRCCGRTVVVLDSRHTAHFLDCLSGKHQASFPLVSATVSDGKMHNYNKPLTAPWLAGGKVIVATEKWLAAYPAGNILAGREPVELRARALRARLLLKLGRFEEARAELRVMQKARPASAVVLALQAEMFGPASPFEDVEAEIIARLQRMRATGATHDKRLYELTGLVKRLGTGAHPTRPLILGQNVYVGDRCGRLWSFGKADPRPPRWIDLDTPIVSDLTFFDYHGGQIVFATENRHTAAVSTDLKLLFDLPSRSNTEYYVLGNRLIRSFPANTFTRLSVLDVKRCKFGPETEVKRYPRRGVLHNGKLYFMRPGGATVSYDGLKVCVHETRSKAADFGVERPAQAVLGVNVLGTFPIVFGSGGLFGVDEHLRPVRRIIPARTRVFAAAVNHGAIATLREQHDGTKPWLLEARTADGAKKLPLRYEMHRYTCCFGYPPTLLPLGRGFLLVGRELVYVEARKSDPLWRFWPGGLRDSDYPAFSTPVLRGKHLFVTHRSGDLLVFETSKIMGQE